MSVIAFMVVNLRLAIYLSLLYLSNVALRLTNTYVIYI